MIYWGINALNHGSSLAIFKDGNLISNHVFKEDLIPRESLDHAISIGLPSTIYWYERPWLKKFRQIYAGQWHRAFDLSVLPSRYLDSQGLGDIEIVYTQHHASHAAAGLYTSGFDKCVVIVLDAIGEWDSATIWKAEDGILTKLWQRKYPDSLGLFYSAFTQLIGLTPISDEGKFEKLSHQGDPKKFYQTINGYFQDTLRLNHNFHRGAWDCGIDPRNDETKADIAAAVQLVFEQQVEAIMDMALSLTRLDSLVYMGGCAMNTSANRTRVEPKFRTIWSLPYPGDPSSSIGSVLFHKKYQLNPQDFGPVNHIRISV